MSPVETRRQTGFGHTVYNAYRAAEQAAATTRVGQRLSPVARGLADRVDALLRRVTTRNMMTSYTVDSLTVRFSSDGYFGTEISSQGYQPRTTRAFRDRLRPGMTVLDIGAHVGHYALVAAKRVGPTGRVFAFEPDATNYAFLERNIIENGLTDVIVPIQKAVADTVGSTSLFVGRRDRVANSIYKTPGVGTRSITCETTTIDAFLASVGWPHVDIVKMDVEGAEHAVLRGMAQASGRNPNMQMFLECFPENLAAAGVSLEDFFQTLTGLGFTYISMILDDLVPVDMSTGIAVVTEQAGRSFVNLLCTKLES